MASEWIETEYVLREDFVHANWQNGEGEDDEQSTLTRLMHGDEEGHGTLWNQEQTEIHEDCESNQQYEPEEEEEKEGEGEKEQQTRFCDLREDKVEKVSVSLRMATMQKKPKIKEKKVPKLKRMEREQLHRESEKLLRDHVVGLQPRKTERRTMMDFINLFKNGKEEKSKHSLERTIATSLALEKVIMEMNVENNPDQKGYASNYEEDTALLQEKTKDTEMVKETQNKDEISETGCIDSLLYPEERKKNLRVSAATLTNILTRDLKNKYAHTDEICLSEEEGEDNANVAITRIDKRNLKLSHCLLKTAKLSILPTANVKVSSKKFLDLENRRLWRVQLEMKRKNEHEVRRIDEELDDEVEDESEMEEIESHEEDEGTSLNENEEEEEEENYEEAEEEEQDEDQLKDDIFDIGASQLPFGLNHGSQLFELTQIASTLPKGDSLEFVQKTTQVKTKEYILDPLKQDLIRPPMCSFSPNSADIFDKDDFLLTQTQGTNTVFLDPNGLLVTKSSVKTYSRKDKVSIYSQETLALSTPSANSGFEVSNNVPAQELSDTLLSMLSGRFEDNTQMERQHQFEKEAMPSLPKSHIAKGFIDDEAEVETDTDVSADEEEDEDEDLVNDELVDGEPDEEAEDIRKIYIKKQLEEDQKDVEQIMDNLQNGWRRNDRHGSTFKINDDYGAKTHASRNFNSRYQRFGNSVKLTQFMSTLTEDHDTMLHRDIHDKENVLDDEELRNMVKRSEMRELKSTMSLSLPDGIFDCDIEIRDHAKAQEKKSMPELGTHYALSNGANRKLSSFTNANQDQLARLSSIQVSEKTNTSKRKAAFVLQSTPDRDKRHTSKISCSTSSPKHSSDTKSLSISQTASLYNAQPSLNLSRRRPSVLFTALGQKVRSNKS